MKNFILLLALVSTLSCSLDSNNNTSDCIVEKLVEYGMIEYTEQELGCNFFLEMYDYNGDQYFVRNNHCADIAFLVTGCEGQGHSILI